MAQVVAFPVNAPRTARRSSKSAGPDGDRRQNVVVFTGVWHERVDSAKAEKRPKQARKKK